MQCMLYVMPHLQQVNSNGVLSFEDTFTDHDPTRFPNESPPLIAPFWQDFNPSLSGNISYRQTNDSDQLQYFETLYSSLVGIDKASGFSPVLLFIVTWDQVPEFDGRSQVFTVKADYKDI